MNTGIDTLVTAQVTTAITAAAGRTGGPAAHAARAWIDGLCARAPNCAPNDASAPTARTPRGRNPCTSPAEPVPP